MKHLLALIAAAALSLSAASAADAPVEQKDKKAAPAPPLKTIVPLTIPKDAKPGENGTFKYTDKDGKKWIYNTTPFGVSRMADMGPAPEYYTAPVASKAIDLGDTVRFEQPGPFGIMHWEKKKSELTDDERKVLDNQQKQQDKKPDQPKAEQK